MSISIRSLLVPGEALAAVGAVALGPSVVTPPALQAALPTVAAPSVHVEAVQLAGFAQDLFYALDGWVAFGVQVAQDFFFWAPEIGAAIGTLYQTLQPVVEMVVNVVATILEGPMDLVSIVTTLATNIFGLPVFSGISAAASAAPGVAGRAAAPDRQYPAPPDGRASGGYR